MNITEFTIKFKSQFVDCDDIEIEPETSFRSIESFDSLTGMAIIVMINDEFGVEIPETIFRALDTPNEIYQYIKSIQK